MKREMSKAEKDARGIPIEDTRYIDTNYYAYSSGRKINLKTGKDEAAGENKLGFWAWLKRILS